MMRIIRPPRRIYHAAPAAAFRRIPARRANAIVAAYNPRPHRATRSLPESERNVLCSVLVTAVSGDTAPLQAALVEALANIPTAELIAVDTPDGAAVGFLGDPLDALAAATSLRRAIAARIAIDF